MKLLLLQLKNIFRYKSRYIVLGLMLLIVSFVVIAAFKAYDMSERTIDRLGMELGSEMTLHKSGIYSPGKEDYSLALETGYIKNIEYIKYVENLLRPQVEIMNDDDETSTIEHRMFFYVVGYNRDEDFGNIPLAEGRLPENDDECVITDGNHIFKSFTDGSFGPDFGRRIEVGDVIDIRNNNSFGDSSTHTLTVVGLARNLNPETTYNGLLLSSFIYTTYEQAESFWHNKSHAVPIKHGDEMLTSGYDAVLNLYTYKDAAKFEEAIRSIALSEKRDALYGEYFPLYSVTFAHVDYRGLVFPFEQLKDTTLLMLLIAAVISVVIVAVMTFMILNERKYDMGVLRCVGMGKGRIMLNISAELLVFFLGVIAVSLAAGYWLSDSVMGLIGTVPESAAGADGLSLFLGVAWKMLLAGLGFAALSSGLSMAYILRYQPMKILINRN